MTTPLPARLRELRDARGMSRKALANASGLFQQAENYHKTAIQITYSLAASNAGLAVGPLFWTPISLRFGRCCA